MRRYFVRSFVAFVCASFAIGFSLVAAQCKNNDISETTNNFVEQVVGPMGATVNGPDGSRVVIPPTALSRDTTIKITALSALPFALPGGWTPLGSTFAFEPHGQSFSIDVTVTIPYTQPSANAVLATAEPGGQWSLVTGTDVAATAITAGTSHFSYYVVVDAGALDSGVQDAGPDCAAELASRLDAAIVPPNKFAGYDLSTGADPRGLSIDEANDGCLNAVNEPAQSNAGLIDWQFGPSIELSYVIDDRIIDLVQLTSGYTGTLAFSSRPGGAYGTHSYVIQIGQPVLRDGSSFPADWSVTTVDGGAQQASEWVNEIFDGLVATFHIGSSATQECLSTGLCLVATNGDYILGVRSIGFYLVFNPMTNVVKGVYEFYTPANPDCRTPIARHQQEDNDPIGVDFGSTIGGLKLNTTTANPNGLTVAQADELLCGGVDAGPPDPGYGAMTWGDAGEILLEYNATSTVAYKLYARPGYLGTLSGQLQSSPDASFDNYAIGVGSVGITKNGTPFETIDWTTEASANPAVTELSNAVQGVNDTDCVMAGDCTIVTNDGAGHSVIGFPNYATYIVFTQGSNTVEQIYNEWAGGQ